MIYKAQLSERKGKEIPRQRRTNSELLIKRARAFLHARAKETSCDL